MQRRLGAFVAVALLSLALLCLLSLGDMRRRTVADAQAQMSNLSQSLADQAHDTFLTLDTVLVGLRERVETDGLQPAARTRLAKLLHVRAALLGMAGRFRVLDSSGAVVVSSDQERAAPADQPVPMGRLRAFQYHRSVAERSMLVGWPVRDPQTGEWIMTVSRRLDGADGTFAGVAMASVPTALFRQSYARFDMGAQGAILLGRSGGTLVSRWPMAPSDEGRDLSAGDLFRRVLRAGDQPRIEHRSLVDGLVRYGSYHWVRGTPLFVMAARSKSEVLAGWRQDAWLHAAGLLGMGAILGLLARRLSGRIAEGETVRRLLLQSNARLVASEARMARANGFLEMGEQIAQIGHWHLDLSSERRLTWSDEIYRLYGQQPGQFTPTLANALAAYHQDDRAMVANAVNTCIETGRAYELMSRLMRPDGGVSHILTRGVPQIDSDGKITSVFGIAMDVTRQRGTEAALLKAHADAEAANEALAAANRSLEALAMQDALTGLANRRHFDRALDREFRRATRSGQSLALIMIDVDYFKRYNDLYGHQAGDACLRAIAGLIPPLLNRPGDTAARYGGEEIAILLPGNTDEGAFTLASRVTDAVRELALAHEGSAAKIVTISAGVHAVTPVHERDVASRLVAQTDRALYAAKHAGRDRVTCFRTIARGVRVPERAADDFVDPAATRTEISLASS